MRKFRYIEPKHGADSLSQYEIESINTDFDIDTTGYYVLAPLKKEEWAMICAMGKERISG